jgi:uncharacterized cupredoxin-like copper-binding protein
MPRTFPLLLVLAAALLLAACTRQEPEISVEEQIPAAARQDESPAEGEGNGGEAPAGETVTFVAVDIDYSEAPATVPAGSVTFELVNEGNLPHDVTIEELADLVVVHADGGETTTGDVDLDSGSYTYYCSIPGHRQAGMEGTFDVS